MKLSLNNFETRQVEVCSKDIKEFYLKVNEFNPKLDDRYESVLFEFGLANSSIFIYNGVNFICKLSIARSFTIKFTSNELTIRMTSFQNDSDEMSNDDSITDLLRECDLGQVEFAPV